MQDRDDSGGKDGLGLLEIRLGVAEVAKHVAAPFDQIEVAIAHGSNSLHNRASRSRTRSISGLGVL